MAEIRALGETASTNDDMALWAGAGAPEGAWLRADRQTGGRGRSGRAWVSPPGNLHASGLVRLRPGDPPATTLALMTAVAAQETLAALLPAATPPQIKWPNDLLVAGAKIAGMLLERRGDAVIVGVGINLRHAPDDLARPTASLAALGGAAVTPGEALAALAEAVDRWLRRWRGEGLEPIRRQWLAQAHPIGTALSAQAGAARIEGLFDGLDGDGALRLRCADGRIETIRAGDVFLL